MKMKKNTNFSLIKSKKPLPSISKSRETPEKQSSELINLESKHDFFEIFAIKSKQCFYVTIPQTLLFEESEKTFISNYFNGKTSIIRSRPLESARIYGKILKEKDKNQIKPSAKKFRENFFLALKRFASVNSFVFFIFFFKIFFIFF